MLGGTAKTLSPIEDGVPQLSHSQAQGQGGHCEVKRAPEDFELRKGSDETIQVVSIRLREATHVGNGHRVSAPNEVLDQAGDALFGSDRATPEASVGHDDKGTIRFRQVILERLRASSDV